MRRIDAAGILLLFADLVSAEQLPLCGERFSS
jgi:hypothetical protein